MKPILLAAAILGGLAFAATARAIPLKMSFTVSDFGTGAPDDPVSGSFNYEASSSHGPILSLDTFNLTIAGFTYSLADVGFENNTVGGTVNGVGTIAPGVNDFYFSIMPGTSFSYTVPGDPTVYRAAGISFSITERQSVPEPASLAVLTIGLAGLVLGRRGLAQRGRETRGL